MCVVNADGTDAFTGPHGRRCRSARNRGGVGGGGFPITVDPDSPTLSSKRRNPVWCDPRLPTEEEQLRVSRMFRFGFG